MRKSLVATAVSAALLGPVWAGDINQQSAAGDDTLTATSTDTFTDIGNDKSAGDNRNNDGTVPNWSLSEPQSEKLAGTLSRTWTSNVRDSQPT